MTSTLKILAAVVLTAALTAGGVAYATPRIVASGSSGPYTNAPNVSVQTEFVPIAPCRVASTRTTGGPLSAGSTRSFYVSGSTGFAGQGGEAEGCGIPFGATAVALSVTTTQSAGRGSLTVFPANALRPSATALSFTAGANATALTIVKLSTSGDVSVYDYGPSTDVVLDVNGYFREPIAATVTSSGSLGYHSNQVTSAVRSATGSYVVFFDENVTGCSAQITAQGSGLVGSGYGSGTQVYVFIHNTAGTGSPSFDGAFALTVAC